MDDYNPRQDSTYALTLFRKEVELKNKGGEDNNGDSDSPSNKPNKPLQVDFWDTAGQERFNSMHPSYYYQAHVCILVFDVTRKQTYSQLKEWYRELREYLPDIPCILVANKIDVDYAVTKKNFKFAQQHGLPFFFVSAADGTNVVKVFDEAVREGWLNRTSGKVDFVTECLELFDDDRPFGGLGKSSEGKEGDDDEGNSRK